MKINLDDIKQFEHELGKLPVKFAQRSAINGTAFTTQKIARNIVGAKMVQRNAFTKRSIQVDMAKGSAPAIVGSIADYMATQEFGGVKTTEGKHGVPIPTAAASGESGEARLPQKLPKRPNRLSNIKLRKGGRKGKNRKQRNRVRVQEAAAAGGRNRFIFLDLGRRKGIYKVTGGKRKPKIRKMYDLSKNTVFIPKNPWLKPAVDKAVKSLPSLYLRALEFQAKRLSLFN